MLTNMLADTYLYFPHANVAKEANYFGRGNYGSMVNFFLHSMQLISWVVGSLVIKKSLWRKS